VHGVAADIGAPMSQLAGLFLVCTVVVAGGEVLQSINQGFVPQEYVPASHSSKYLCFTHIGYLTDASESFLVVKKEGYNMGCIVASGLPTENRLGQRSFPSAHVAHFLVNGKHVCCEVVPSPDGSFPSIRVDAWDQDSFTRNDWLGGVTLSGMEAGPQHYNMPEHHDSVTSLFSESDTRGTFDLDLVVVEQPDPAEYVVSSWMHSPQHISFSMGMADEDLLSDSEARPQPLMASARAPLALLAGLVAVGALALALRRAAPKPGAPLML
jgi:hypothetical protein